MAGEMITVKAAVDTGRTLLWTTGNEHITDENPTGEVYIKGDGGVKPDGSPSEHVVAPTGEIGRLIRMGLVEVVSGENPGEVTQEAEQAMAENAEARQLTGHPSLPPRAARAGRASSSEEADSAESDDEPKREAGGTTKAPSEAKNPAAVDAERASDSSGVSAAPHGGSTPSTSDKPRSGGSKS